MNKIRPDISKNWPLQQEQIIKELKELKKGHFNIMQVTLTRALEKARQRNGKM